MNSLLIKISLRIKESIEKILQRALQRTVDSKIARALAKILAIFLWFDCQFLSFHASYKQYKYLFIKSALNRSFLTRTISSARTILLPTLNICQVMIFRLYTVYNKYDVIKFGNK